MGGAPGEAAPAMLGAMLALGAETVAEIKPQGTSDLHGTA
jgi:hypothetical protein